MHATEEYYQRRIADLENQVAELQKKYDLAVQELFHRE